MFGMIIVLVSIRLNNTIMLKKFKVEVFCEKSDMNGLIRKVFSGCDYDLHFNDSAYLNIKTLSSLDPSCDIIIADKSIEKGLHEIIRKKFPDVPVICLPGLETEEECASNVKYISEPLKLSELKKVVEETLIK